MSARYQHCLLLAAFGACLSLTSVPALAAATMSVNFETFPLGALPGGADLRTPGNANTWWVPDNAATGAEVQAGVGRGGSQGLYVFNRGNGNDGVIDNVKSGRLAQTAGESSTGAPNNTFYSEFWFRTESRSTVESFQFKTESWGADRTTWLAFLSYDQTFVAPGPDDGKIYVEASGFSADGGSVDNALLATLDWGEWYRVATQVLFVDGADNDVVTYSIFDDLGALVGTLNNKTWEEGQRFYGLNGGNLVAPDAVGFQMRGSDVAARGVYIDDVFAATEPAATVPEPATPWLLLVGLAVAGRAAGRRRASGVGARLSSPAKWRSQK